MNRHIIKILIVVLTAALFSFLFYRATLGLNLVIFEIAVYITSIVLFRNSLSIRKQGYAAFTALLAVSIVSVVFTHTAYSIAVNIFIFLHVMALNLWPDAAKNYLLSLIAPLNIRPALVKGIKAILGIRKPGIFRKWPGLWLTTGSLLIIWLFIAMYSASNSHFSNLANDIRNFITDLFSRIFDFENADIILYFLIGVLIACALLIRTDVAARLKILSDPGNILKRTKTHLFFKSSYRGFLKWFRTGIFLMSVLNIIILVFNYLDLVYVWISFEWNGQLLREFIHEGTWTLVFCIALSALLALLFFNGKIHFYSKNKMLKWLIRIWVGQNIFMLVSVIVRNVRYIHYYNLASLRIGVFIFLSIAAFALIVLMIKINKGRNMFWLYKKVFIFSAIILTLTSALNWNRIIARYNISHRESAYFHYDYMVMLPQTIDIMMENRDVFCIPYSSSRYHTYTEKDFSKTNPEKYSEVIDHRIESIRQELQKKDWREWNYPDFRILKYLEDN